MQLLTRTGIQTPNADRSDSADVPRDIRAVSTWLESNGLIWGGQGTSAARPVSTPASPGKAGRIYMVTDVTPHRLDYDEGTQWTPIGNIAAGSVDNTALADNAVTLAKMADNSVSSAEIVDGSVRGSDTSDVQREILQGSIRYVDISPQLKPSQGASAATEALRALGSGAGQAAAGNDSRLSDPRVFLGYNHGFGGNVGLGGGGGANDPVTSFPQSGTYIVNWGVGYQSNSQGGTANVTLYVNNSPVSGAFQIGGFNVEFLSRATAISVVAGWNCFINISDNGPGGTYYAPWIWLARYQ
jgi:hypothetical protein